MSVANNECEGSQKTRKIKMLDFDFLGRLPLFRYALHDRSICIITIFIAFLNLNSSLVHSSSLSFMSFWRPKGRKGPAPGKTSLTVLCSGVASNILQSNRHCHLNFLFDFVAVRDSFS